MPSVVHNDKIITGKLIKTIFSDRYILFKITNVMMTDINQ